MATNIPLYRQSPPGALFRGGMLLALTVLFILAELTGQASLKIGAGGIGALYMAGVVREVRWSRRAFVIIGLALSGLALLVREDGRVLVGQALAAGGFVVGFFIALSSLRAAVGSSVSIQRCGEYLATRTPGKRYLALTLGGHLFSLVLNYGSISLLGTLVEKAESDPDGRPRNAVRVRRMLMAIQRGFVTTLCWSPLAFSMAVGTSVISGSRWEGAVAYGLVSALLLGLVGWGVDRNFKPPPSPNGTRPLLPAGNMRSLLPLLYLLLTIGVAVVALQAVSGVSTSTSVMTVVPLVSLIWIAIQSAGTAPVSGLEQSWWCVMRRRLEDYLARELENYKSEMVLLYMAAFIGKLGSALAAPWVAAHALDFSTVPFWVILPGLVLGLPVLGQIGMHPILSVSLIGPMLPDASTLGVSPDVVLVALTLGWAFCGASSPFTATVLLVAAFGKVSALTVGLRWNAWFLALGGLAAVLWVLALAVMTR